MQYKKSKIFLAECKFWKGEKHYLKHEGPIAKQGPISQLLEYMDWYTTKSAVILFVRASLSGVLRTVKETTLKHPNFMAYDDEQDEGWFNYRFRSAKDSEREIKLAVFLFHTPKIDISDTIGDGIDDQP